MKRIAIDLLWRPLKSGIGRFGHEVARNLIEIGEFDYIILSLYREDFYSKAKEVLRIHGAMMGRRRLKEILFKYLLHFYLRGKRIDLYYSTHFFLPRHLEKTIKKIVTIHDLAFLEFPHFYKKSAYLMWKKMTQESVQTSDRIVAVSEFTKNALMRFFNTPEEKISVVYEGVSEPFRRLEERERELLFEEVRKRYDLPDEFILYVGDLGERKNVPNLIDSYANIIEKNSGLPPLVLVGRRIKGFEKVFERIRSRNVSKKVIHLENLPDRDLLALYNKAILFVYPSLYEGFGLRVLEAMACGAPVIASRESSIPEVVGEAGILFNPRDGEEMAFAIETVLKNEELRREMSRRGIKRAEKFSWKESSRKLINLFKKVLVEK